MKLSETLIYSILVFLFVYVVLSLTLRLFEITSDYTSHMIGGITATLVSVILFVYLLLRNQKS